jgi:tetratricopeptide (TPR) repeat protein
VRRRILIASLGVVLTAGIALGAFSVLGRREVTTSSAEALRFYRLGRENERKLYRKEAIAAYAEALKNDPNFVMATVHLAELLRAADPERARSLFDGVKRRADGITERERLQVRLFEMVLDGKRGKEIEPLLNECVQRYPQDPEAYFHRAQLLSRTNRMPEAIADLERVIALEPNFAFAYNTLGYYWLGEGDYAKAEDYLRRYRFLAPDQANPYDSLGEFYLSVGRYEEAEENLKKAIDVKPDFYPARAHLGTLEVARGNLPAAADEFRSAAEKTDDPTYRREWYWSAAVTLAVAGRMEEASSLAERIPPLKVDIDEKQQKARERLERLHRSLFLSIVGRVNEATAELEALQPLLADLQPEPRAEWEHDMSIARGFIAARLGRHDEAVEEFRKAIPKTVAPGGFGYFPGRDMLRVVLAKNLVLLGRVPEAEEALKPLLSRNPKFQPALDVLERLRPTAQGAAAGGAGVTSARS